MAETIISLDKSRQPARFDAPEIEIPSTPELRKIGVVLAGVIFLIALVLLIWIIVSLFSSRFSINSLPLIGSDDQVKQLDL